MTFTEFQLLNHRRCREAFPSCNNWDPPMWCLAIAGESGELCNLMKKIARSDFSLEDKREAVLNELADIITYCDLLVTELGANTENILMKKFKEVSMRRGWKP